ncbi:MAG: hypothetical protein ACPIOQ_66185, partial [Promethearchaeia archaeon]
MAGADIAAQGVIVDVLSSDTAEFQQYVLGSAVSLARPGAAMVEAVESAFMRSGEREFAHTLGRLLRRALRHKSPQETHPDRRLPDSLRRKRAKTQDDIQRSSRDAALAVMTRLRTIAETSDQDEEHIQGVMDAVAIAGGTRSLLELLSSPGQGLRAECGAHECSPRLPEQSALDPVSRSALYDALAWCELPNMTWSGGTVHGQMRRHARLNVHLSSWQLLWQFAMLESDLVLRRRAAAAIGRMDEKTGILFPAVLDSLEAEEGFDGSLPQSDRLLFQTMWPYLARQIDTRRSEARPLPKQHLAARYRLEQHVATRYRLRGFKFPDFEIKASFGWSEFSVVLGLCAPKQSAVSFGDENIGFNLDIEICDQARAWIPYFGPPGYSITI